MAKNLELNGLIHSKYESESAFARALGWPRQRLNKITSGVKEPDISETVMMARKLDVTVDRLADIFLPQQSPNG